MKKRSIGLIIGLMGMALLGVMAMQLYFLVQTYHMQSDLFDRNVGDALSSVVSKIDKHDRVNFIKVRTRMVDSQNNVTGGFNTITLSGTTTNKHFVNRKVIIRDSLKNVSHRLQTELSYPDQQLRVYIETFTDEAGNMHQRESYKLVNTPPVPLAAEKKLQRYDTLHYDYIDPQLGRQVVSVAQENPLWKAEQVRKQKLKEYRSVRRLLELDSMEELKKSNNRVAFDNIAEEYSKMNEPLKKRIDPLWIDSLLRFELHNKGIYLPFSYTVSNANNDSLIFSKAMDLTGDKPVFTLINTPYQTPIFAKDVLTDPGMLRLAFPQKSTLILNRMAFSMGTSGGLLLVLIFCFGYTIFSILRQKKISEMKTDFINNMTHEFKTPVSTIMIASEALKDDEVVADRSRITRLANIIYEENARLGSHIERVLNIARIEKNDFRLDIIPLDVNETLPMCWIAWR
jgi:two-component system phosphate regulon sensor histidine kinase PhoR